MASEEKKAPMEMTAEQQGPMATGEQPPDLVEAAAQEAHAEAGEQPVPTETAAQDATAQTPEHEASTRTDDQHAPAAAEAVHRNVFVLIDDSPASHTMWKWAQEHALRAGDHVTLVTVARVFTYWASLAHGDAVMTTLTGGHEFAVAKTEAQEMLKRLKEAAAPTDWTIDMEVVTATEDAGIGEVLVAYLNKHSEADEAIIGSRHMGAFKKVMMTLVGKGSVSDYVVKHAPCPVEVYPA